MKMNLKFFGETAETESQGTKTITQTNETKEDVKDQSTQEKEDKAEKQEQNTNFNNFISKEELEKILKAEREKAVEEAIKIAKMSDADKKSYEEEQKIKNLEEREKTVAIRELKAEAINLLAKEDIDVSLVDIIIGKNLDDTKNNIKAFKATFDKAVQLQVEKRLAGKPPKGGSNNINTQDTGDFLGVIKSNQVNRK